MSGGVATRAGVYALLAAGWVVAAWVLAGSVVPDDLSPPYWISMGAMAISALAGSMLVANSPDAPFLASLAPFLKGFTVFYWATGTWWIPMLVVLGVWRHGYRRFPLRYDPLYWGAVFPLGMYTACTYRLSQVIAAPWLAVIAHGFVYVALAAWCLAALGLGRALFTRLMGRAAGSTP